MKVKVSISHEEKLITSVFGGVMVLDDMNNYFEKFMSEIPQGAKYFERVDFTGVNKFEITHDGFLDFAKKAAEVFASQRVGSTEFIVASQLQMGMARMFSSMADEGGVEFIFTKTDSD